MIGRRLRQFLIEEPIGAGGMGVVYRARDERLDRRVAVKVLPAGSLDDGAARTRFRQEAALLAKVNHPNIATIHDFDRCDGIDFLVMELVEGVGLEQKIAEGPIAEDSIRNLGQQICSGLEAAHQLGIIHRDLKPGNIRITPDARLKILDFGLAKAFPLDPPSSLTVSLPAVDATGVAGTLPYMAPEQLWGRPLDARTDLHAVGAILYEMATGCRPFSAEGGAAALIARIAGERPAAPGTIQGGLSEALERVILRCLEKEPAARYSSARELALDLQPTARPDVPGVTSGSVAVLPFVNLAGDLEVDYLRFALPEAVTTALSRIANLSVRPLASTRKYEPDTDLQAVGETLRVRMLITGAFARPPGALRVSIEATEASTLRALWSGSITVGSQEMLALPLAIRSLIAEDLLPALGLAPMRVQSTARLPRHQEGYELYLRSIALGMDDAPNTAALRLLNQSVELDPPFATAWVELGRREYVAGSYGGGGAAAYRRSEAAYQRALALDPDAVEAAVGLAGHLTEAGDLRAAYSVAAGILARRPESRAGHQAMAYLYRYAGLHQLSAEHAATAWRIDRDSALGSLALTHLALENYPRTLEFVALRAGTMWADNVLMQLLLHQNNRPEALAVAERLSIDAAWPARFVAAYLRGEPAEDVRALAEAYIARNLRVLRDPESSYLDGALLAFCGQRQKGVDLIRRGIDGGYAAYPNLQTDPLLADLRSTPGYSALLAAGRRVQERFVDFLREGSRPA